LSTPPNLGVTCFFNQTLLAMVLIDRMNLTAWVPTTRTGEQVQALMQCMMTNDFPSDIKAIVRGIMRNLGIPAHSQEDIDETFLKVLHHFNLSPSVCLTSGRECSICGVQSRVQTTMELILRLSIPDTVSSVPVSSRTLQSLFEPSVEPGNFDCHSQVCLAEEIKDQRNCLGHCGGDFCVGKKFNAAKVTEQVGSPLAPFVVFTINVNQGFDLVSRPVHFAPGRAKFICSRQVVLSGCTYDVVYLIVHVSSRLEFEPKVSEFKLETSELEPKGPLFSHGHFIGYVLGDECIEHDDDKRKVVSWDYV